MRIILENKKFLQIKILLENNAYWIIVYKTGLFNVFIIFKIYEQKFLNIFTDISNNWTIISLNLRETEL